MKKHLLTLLALAALTSATVAQVPSYVPSNGLVGWWPFNGNANDESGNGNNGAVNGATLTTDRFGNANSAYDFDGVDDFIQMSNVGNLYFENDFSISMWCNISDFNNDYLHLISGENNFIAINGNGPSYLTDAQKISAYQGPIFTPSLRRIPYFATNSTLTANSDYHVVFVKNQDTAYLYLNGILQGFSVADNLLSIPSGNYVQIGSGYNNSSDYCFNGSLDDIGIWDRALTLCEIEQLYLAQAISIPSASITPISATTFCEGSSVELSVPVADSYLWSTGETTQSIIVDASDTYSVTVTNGTNCNATSEAVTVTVYQNPVVSLAPFASICGNASAVVLSGGSPSGGTFTVNGNPASQLDPSSTGSGQQTVVYTYTDGNGCLATATQQVTVNPVPVVTLAGLESGYLPTDAPVQLNGSPAGGVFNGTGVSNGQFDPAAAGLGTHSVQYVVVGANGCVGSSGLCTTVDLTTGSGIGLDNGGNGVEVYPNPSNGLFTVVMDGMDGIVQLSVMDIRGREVASQSLTARGRTNHSIDLSGFASGVYTLRIQSAKGTSGIKLVKE